MSFAILCPGQGGQHPGMFARIAQLPVASEVIATAASVLGADPIALAADPHRFDNAIALACWSGAWSWPQAQRSIRGRSASYGSFAVDSGSRDMESTSLKRCRRIASCGPVVGLRALFA